MRASWLLLIATVLGSGCHRSARPHDPDRDEVTLAWRTLGSWSGRESVQTQSFVSETGILRISWSSRGVNEATGPALRVVINSAVSGRPILYPIDVHEPGEDIVYVNDDPRIYYATVDASNAAWHLTIEDGVAGQVPGRRASSEKGR